jgi:hypothetical protein
VSGSMVADICIHLVAVCRAVFTHGPKGGKFPGAAY